jgi:nitrate/nitrite transporter NarK
MFFGLGSEIAGTAVTRSIARWFRGGPMALAMGLQLAIARLGTAFALVLAPRLVQERASGVYSLAETARPALVGMALMAAGLILWAFFVALDARAERSRKLETSAAQSDAFRFSDVLKILTNKNFWLCGILCVLFYSSIIAFKKFAGAILVPRFDIPAQTAGWMVAMLPFSTVIFAPLFGILVDKRGRGTRWMMLGAVLALAAHLLLAFAPQGVPFFGYLAMVLLGFGYSLVPAALWPSVPKIVPDKVLGTTFALVYWVQNLGLLAFKMLAGRILGAAGSGADAALRGSFSVELMFTALCVAAVAVALLFSRTSRLHPELGLDAPNKT